MSVRGSLAWRLLGAQLLVLGIAVVVSGFAVSQLAAHTFMVIMMRYHIEPAAIEAEFHAAFRRILITSVAVAATIGMVLAWTLVSRIVRPLQEMMMLSERIAQGDYGRRVRIRSRDEIGRLGDALNRMAASLQRIEALRRDLVANVAHELRTPLATLRGYLEALGDGVAPATAETFDLLHEEVLRLVRLVDALHQLSQFDASLSRLRRAPLDLRVLLQRIAAVYGPRFSERRLRLMGDYDGPLPEVAADADLVHQAVRNLLDNALRYAPAGGDVRLGAESLGSAVRLVVSNTGEGIAADDLPHIFERFYRGEKSRSRETGGAGIGLSIVREIARAHGGETGAASRDGATTVWFTLPLRAA